MTKVKLVLLVDPVFAESSLIYPLFICKNFYNSNNNNEHIPIELPLTIALKSNYMVMFNSFQFWNKIFLSNTK